MTKKIIANHNTTSPRLNHKLSVAPMLDWTDKHCRYFYRLLSKETVLYTEMVTTGAILRGRGDYLSYNEAEHPLVLQLGGSDVSAMTECAKIAEQYGYDEININLGNTKTLFVLFLFLLLLCSLSFVLSFFLFLFLLFRFRFSASSYRY